MAETAVSLARQHLLPKIWEAVKMLRDLKKEVKDTKVELRSLECFINDADKMVEAEEYKDRLDLIKELVTRLREAGFRMEDVIDKYMLCGEKQPGDLGCAALPCEAFDYIKTLILHLQIAYEIREVRSLVRAERDDFQRHFPSEPRPCSSRGNQNVTWHKLRMDPLSQGGEVVGLDRPTDELKNLLTKGRKDRTVISVVGIPGVGKTTLAKHVFDKVHKDFECHGLITVSQSYNVEELLRKMLEKLFYDEQEAHLEKVSKPDHSEMDRITMIEEVQKCLHNKRYVVLFDDVWNEKFWDDVESALIDNKKGSRILITTRYEKVAHFCKRSSFLEVHKLENPLSEEESFKLFCKKAFWYSSEGHPPEELKDISLEIVRKCKYLPLAIVAVGGLLSQKDKSAPEWTQFSQNSSLKLNRNSELNSIENILRLSYDDLPFNLRPCLMYFGMYPEDYEIKSNTLIRQWIVEGFVKPEEEKTLEEVANQYLVELILRSLVQVCSLTTGGKIKVCRVHDLLHELILKKMKDTSFCEYIGEHNRSVSSGIIRRLAIEKASNNLIESIETSHIRSIVVMTHKGLSKDLVLKIHENYMPLKILVIEDSGLYYVPRNFGNLIQLKYLSFRNSGIQSLPKSIGELKNLETLDVRQTCLFDIPKEICKLRKLQHLLANKILSATVKDSLGGMVSLQKILSLEIDRHGMVLRELGKLKNLNNLRIYGPKVIDLTGTATLPALRKLFLIGKFTNLASWFPKLQNLVKLTLVYSESFNDPLESLKDLPNLLFLYIGLFAYSGESLLFQCEGFKKLKQLKLQGLYSLNSIIIEEGALQSLERLCLMDFPNLTTAPSGIQHLKKLQVLDVSLMPTEFVHGISTIREQAHWILQRQLDIPVSSSQEFLDLYMLRSRLSMSRRLGMELSFL